MSSQPASWHQERAEFATRVLVALAPVNYRVSVVLWRFQPPEGMTLVSLQRSLTIFSCWYFRIGTRNLQIAKNMPPLSVSCHRNANSLHFYTSYVRYM